MTQPRPPRLRLLPPEAADAAAAPTAGSADAALLDRLSSALAALPPAERAAAVVAFGLDEGTAGVADGLELSAEDADALTRNALQLLRGALTDVDPDPGESYARLVQRRRAATPAE